MKTFLGKLTFASFLSLFTSGSFSPAGTFGSASTGPHSANTQGDSKTLDRITMPILEEVPSSILKNNQPDENAYLHLDIDQIERDLPNPEGTTVFSA